MFGLRRERDHRDGFGQRQGDLVLCEENSTAAPCVCSSRCSPSSACANGWTSPPHQRLKPLLQPASHGLAESPPIPSVGIDLEAGVPQPRPPMFRLWWTTPSPQPCATPAGTGATFACPAPPNTSPPFRCPGGRALTIPAGTRRWCSRRRPCLQPRLDCWLITRGIKTLPLRLKQQMANAAVWRITWRITLR